MVDDPWAALFAQIGELQQKLATLESRLDTLEEAGSLRGARLTDLEDEVTGFADLLSLEKRLYESFEEIARKLGVSLFTIWDGQAGRRS